MWIISIVYYMDRRHPLREYVDYNTYLIASTLTTKVPTVCQVFVSVKDIHLMPTCTKQLKVLNCKTESVRYSAICSNVPKRTIYQEINEAHICCEYKVSSKKRGQLLNNLNCLFIISNLVYDQRGRERTYLPVDLQWYMLRLQYNSLVVINFNA